MIYNQFLIECEQFVFCYYTNIVSQLIALLTCRPGTHFSYLTFLDFIFIYVLHAFVLLLLIVKSSLVD